MQGAAEYRIFFRLLPEGFAQLAGEANHDPAFDKVAECPAFFFIRFDDARRFAFHQGKRLFEDLRLAVLLPGFKQGVEFCIHGVSPGCG